LRVVGDDLALTRAGGGEAIVIEVEVRPEEASLAAEEAAEMPQAEVAVAVAVQVA